MEEDTATPVYPRLEPHHSFWKASPETPEARGSTPLGLPSGMRTNVRTQGVAVAPGFDTPPAAVVEKVGVGVAGVAVEVVSNWKESGLVAAFSSHWIRQ